MGSAAHLWNCLMSTDIIPRSHRISPSINLTTRRRLSLPNHCASSAAALTLSRERSAPWLLLPQSTDKSVYEFYSLTEKSTFRLEKKRRNSEEEEEEDNCTVLGSSHGWLILLNRYTGDLHMSNPVSHRHIRLPSLGRFGSIDFVKARVILTSSPDDLDCLVIVSLLPKHSSLVFCVPGRSSEWTHMAPPEWDDIKKIRNIAVFYDNPDGNPDGFYGSHDGFYDDYVYMSQQKLLYCLTSIRWLVDVWDLADPTSPRVDWMCEQLQRSPGRVKSAYLSKRYLVVHDHPRGSNEVFVVVRYIKPRMGPDGSYANHIHISKYRGWDCSYPPKTFDFEVYRVDMENERGIYMKDSLDGLVMFLGNSQTVVVPASEFPELKPNSIYFTYDDHAIPGSYMWPAFGRHDDSDFDSTVEYVWSDYDGNDNGIFDYETKTFSSISTTVCPFDYQKPKRMPSAPLWLLAAPKL